MQICRSASRFALVDALNVEWSQLDDDPVLAGYSRAEIGRWAIRRPALSGCLTPSDVLAAIRTDPDPILGSLIAIHQAGTAIRCGRSERSADAQPATSTGQELAGRILLQTMLGKLVAMARRDRAHAVEDYVAQFWARLGSYPLARRRRRIAANLALDTLKAVIGDGGRSNTYVVLPMLTEELEAAGLASWGRRAVEPTADLDAWRVLRVAEQLGLIDESTRRLLLSVYAEGLTSAEAADRYGLTPTTVRFRCSQAVRRLAGHAAEIAEVA